MKGYFSLNKALNHNGDPLYLMFGNLGRFSRCSDVRNQMCLTEGYATEETARLIAHDVVEHSVAHRTNKSITVEDELKALGAMVYVRFGQVEVNTDVAINVRCLYGRELLAPKISHHEGATGITVEEIDGMCRGEDCYLEQEELEAVLSLLDLGYYTKQRQYKGDRGKANRDFRFIQEESLQAAQACMSYCDYSGVSCYFDTDLQIFRFRAKRDFSHLY